MLHTSLFAPRTRNISFYLNFIFLVEIAAKMITKKVQMSVFTALQTHVRIVILQSQSTWAAVSLSRLNLCRFVKAVILWGFIMSRSAQIVKRGAK